ELRDQMRDRRTLFMVAVLPLLLYPAMGIGMVQMTVLFSEQPRTVVLLGADELPKQPQLLDGDQFVSNWFTIPSDADKLRVITDSQPENTDSESTDTETNSEREEILKQAHQLELELKQHQSLLDEWDKLKGKEDSSEAELLLHEITETKERLSKQFAESKIQVLIIIPKGLSKELEQVSAKLALHEPIDFDPAVSSRPLILRNRADEKSKLAFIRVQEAMDAWEKAILRARLNRARLPVSLPTPINPE
ncbi:MAG TPA: CPBP family intramembrane metalloprotease domain-containing protein, partial [Planctomycetaceae bacterium]|nr:CPBP family intramembrane metalloprotease domain-containing protein [Planctomycetaceae bacterium]